MSSQLGNKRRFLDGRDDWRFQTEKAPVTTSADQFIQGQKVFNDPVIFYQDLKCEGAYRGDGSQLTGIVPSHGGFMTGQLSVPSLRFNNDTIQTTAYKSLVPATYSNANIVVNSFGQIDAIYNGGGGGGPATSISLNASPEDNFYYYPVFGATAQPAQTLYVDTATSMLRYNPFLGKLDCPTFNGTLTGNASTASQISVADPTLTTTNHYVLFSDGLNSNQTVRAESSLKYNSDTHVLETTTFKGALDGIASSATNAANATTASTATVATTLNVTEHSGTGSTHHVLFVDNAPLTGPKNVQVKTNLEYRTSTNTLYAPNFAGSLTGNVTGNVTGSAGSALYANAVSVGTTYTTNPHYLSFVDNTSGTEDIKVDTSLKYDTFFKTLTCPNFAGTLAGSASTTGALDVFDGATDVDYSILMVQGTSGNGKTVCVDGGLNPLAYNPNTNILKVQTLNANSITGTALNNYVTLTGTQNLTNKTFTDKVTVSTTVNSEPFTLTANVGGVKKSLTVLNSASASNIVNTTTTSGDIVVYAEGASTTSNIAANYTLSTSAAADPASKVGLRLQSTTGTNTSATLTGGRNSIILNSQNLFTRMNTLGITIGEDATSNNNFYVGGATSGTAASQQLFIGRSMDVLRTKAFTNANAFNIAIGQGAGRNFNGGTSQDCVALGRSALGQAGITLGGSDNIGIGTNTGYKLNATTATTACRNIMIGTNSGYEVTTGESNTLVGYQAGLNISTQTGNTCIGNLAGGSISSSASSNGNNVFIGNNAGFIFPYNNFLTGAHNIGLGYQSLANLNGESNGNIAIGYQAGYNLQTTDNPNKGSISIGYQAGPLNNGTTNRQLVIGSGTAFNYSGSNSLFIGHGSGTAVTTSGNNLILGHNSGLGALSTNNTIIGSNCATAGALGSCTIVGYNSGVGGLGVQNTLFGNGNGNLITGASNSVFGRGAATALTTGIGNIVIGCNNAVDLVGGSYNVLIASGTGATNNSTGTVNENDDVKIGRLNLAKFHFQGGVFHNVLYRDYSDIVLWPNNADDNILVTSPFPQYTMINFAISANANRNIDFFLPSPSAARDGQSIRFRKWGTAGSAFNINTAATYSEFVGTNASVAATIAMATTQYNLELVCMASAVTAFNATPTYYWYITYIV